MSKKVIIFVMMMIFLPLIIGVGYYWYSHHHRIKRHKPRTYKMAKPDPRKCEHPDGIDISHHNRAYDWNKVKVKFCFVRATMGSTIKDKRYNTHRMDAAKQKIPVGAYHFLTAKTDAKTQFDFFSSVVKKSHLQLRPVLDVEESKYWGAPKGFTDWDAHLLIRKWCDLCKQEYGVAPIIYTTETLYRRYKLNNDFDDCIWWVANYNNVNNYEKKCIIPYTIHQYSHKKYVEGFYGFVDCNRFATGKTVDDLKIVKAKKAGVKTKRKQSKKK